METNSVNTSINERFWEKVDIRGHEECWKWKGSILETGYGQFYYRGGPVRAHRIAYMLTNWGEPMPPVVMHKCDNPACCNPYHLVGGTQSENMQDCVRKNRRGVTERKLKATDAEHIRTLYASGNMTQIRIAAIYGIGRPMVSQIVNKRAWVA